MKSLTVKMNTWAESLGAALSHQPVPAKLDARPAPEGEVLEVTVTVTAQAKPKDTLIVPVASWEGNQFATDYVEYDIAIAPDSLRRGFYHSPFIGNDSKSMKLAPCLMNKLDDGLLETSRCTTRKLDSPTLADLELLHEEFNELVLAARR